MKIEHFWVFVVAAVVLLFLFFRGFGEELPVPGKALNPKLCLNTSECGVGLECINQQCTNPYPKEGICDGKKVLEYGMPTYHLDPKMQHMNSLGCVVDNQCNAWKPLAALKNNITTECCTNSEICYNDPSS